MIIGYLDPWGYSSLFIGTLIESLYPRKGPNDSLGRRHDGNGYAVDCHQVHLDSTLAGFHDAIVGFLLWVLGLGLYWLSALGLGFRVLLVFCFDGLL